MKQRESARAQKIRSRMAAERPLVAELDSQIKESYLKQVLQRASFWLDDLENFLLPQAEKAATSGSESRWIDIAELTLQNAVQQREIVQKLADKYGTNLRST